MVWTKLNDTYSDDCATLSDAAFRTHTEALNWTMRRETEGRITRRDLRRFAETDDPDKAVAELVDMEWWEDHDSGDGWQVVHDMPDQRTKEQIGADRAAAADRQRRWREAHGKKPRRNPGEEPPRPDVERLCIHLADRIEAGGSNRPTIGKRWRDAARLLLDEDKRTEEQVHKAIDWSQGNSFWRSHIMSMAKLREKYDTLRVQADEERRRGSGNGAPGGQGSMRGGARQQLLSADEINDLDPGRIA
jgi:hypothetical protein